MTASQKLLLTLVVLSAGALLYLWFQLQIIESGASQVLPSIQPSNNINLWTIFFTGLLTGALTCLAVQGGLLATTIAQREEEKIHEKSKESGNARPIIAFLASKLLAYTILGLLLGWFGSLFTLSLTTQVIMQVAVAIFMLGTALSILNVHPVFHYFIIQPPKFLTRMVRNKSKSKSIFAPAILGSFTVFIPCGTTQAMMALAIGSGSPLLGAAILFAFILGTSPLFFVLGYFATKLSKSLHSKFMKTAAAALIILAVFNLNNAIALTGSKFTLENMWCGITSCNKVETEAIAVAPKEEITINFLTASYSPSNITVKAGSNIKLKLVNTQGQGCIQAFTIPQYGIQRIIPVGTSDVIEFTAPTEPGQVTFMCSMGMYRGVINVI